MATRLPVRVTALTYFVGGPARNGDAGKLRPLRTCAAVSSSTNTLGKPGSSFSAGTNASTRRSSAASASSCSRSEEHTSELQSPMDLVCHLLLEKNPTGGCAGCGAQKRDRAPRHQAGQYFCHRARFFFNDTATSDIYTLSLHDALPI